ncbi:hypothetical protein HDK77DRAFT_455776 [Phyllosticta capitalensis]|uniref:choline dehydrogenase n=1 Tax=Phyllosticta capitalensis TaxID=121624 RepID=UPI003131E146
MGSLPEQTTVTSVTSLRFTDPDFVIIGGGLSGLVVANRLTEDANNKVLVVEAGANRMGDPRIDTEGLMTTLYGDPDYDWDYMTEPQTHANGRQIPHPRGKVLGGSTAINFGVVVYPSKKNFEAWEALGNDGWSAEDLKPYFKKWQTFTPASEDVKKAMEINYYHEKNHGTDGPVPVTNGNNYGPFNEAWVKTHDKLGLCNDDDPILGEKLGAFTNSLSIDAVTRKRGYAAEAYYSKEVAKRPNLQVLTEALVHKILTKKEDDGVVATGIKFETNDGSIHEIKAQKEVILAGGAMNSPQILELSGIGQKELLEKHNIPVVIESPGVGQNLQDHAMVPLSYEIADGQVSADMFRDPKVVNAALQEYQEKKSGPLASIPFSVAYLPFSDGNGRLSKDQIQELLNKYADDSDATAAEKRQYELLRSQMLTPKDCPSYHMYAPMQFNMQPSGRDPLGQIVAPTKPGNYISIVVVLNHPFSRGFVHIKSADPKEKAIVDPRYLSKPMDLEILARHVQNLEAFVKTEPYASLLKPGRRLPEDGDTSTLDGAKEVVKSRLVNTFHPTGTCAMMPKELDGVVDTRLKLYGAKNLRVVDASIFPMEPLGNIQTSVYAIAERAADIIKEDWKA